MLVQIFLRWSFFLGIGIHDGESNGPDLCWHQEVADTPERQNRYIRPLLASIITRRNLLWVWKVWAQLAH